MVEKSYASECHGNAILVAGVDNMVIAHAASGLCYVFNSTLMSTLDIVAKGEESVAAKGNARVLGYPLLLLFASEHLGLLLEELLPCAFAQYVIMVVGDIHVDGVVAIGAADVVNKRQRHYLRMLA